MENSIILTTPEALKSMLWNLLDEYFRSRNFPAPANQQPVQKAEEKYYDRDKVC